jgi:hypothetical protein
LRGTLPFIPFDELGAMMRVEWYETGSCACVIDGRHGRKVNTASDKPPPWRVRQYSQRLIAFSAALSVARETSPVSFWA